jgi:hypothetical protein
MSLTVVQPGVGGTGNANLTFPNTTGTVMVSGNMPAFGAYLSADQTGISANTYTKVRFNTELFDTANCYDNATNYRFTPTVAGYYQINTNIYITANGVALSLRSVIYKNGSQFSFGNWIFNGSNNIVTDCVSTASALVYCNGSTDYIEIYAYVQGYTGQVIGTSPTVAYFNGYLARTA